MNADHLTSKHDQEFASLRKARASTWLRWSLIFVVALAIIFLLLRPLISSPSSNRSFQNTRSSLSSVSPRWGRKLILAQAEYSRWIERRGTRQEYKAFQVLSENIFQAALSVVALTGQAEPGGFIENSYVTLLFAGLRISFLFLASWRLCLFVTVVGFLLSSLAIRVHEGEDLLGQTGNGRFFYSGIRAALENLTPSGAPKLLVTGLACPKQAEREVMLRTSLGKLLLRKGVDNETNRALAGIIVAHKEWPAYVVSIEEEELLNKTFSGANLLDVSSSILEAALDLQSSYHQALQEDRDLSDKLFADQFKGPSGQLGMDEFSIRIKELLHRVLSVERRKVLAEIKPQALATLVLAYQAGKVMAYSYEGGIWVKSSNFSQLTARSVLHSVSAFAKDYDYDERQDLRRALIYGARSGAFGPVRFASDLSPQARALRQWVELLMAAPHEFDVAADEIELFGLVSEIQLEWKQTIFSFLMALGEKDRQHLYATQTNLLILPLALLVKSFREIVDSAVLERLVALIDAVSSKQQLNRLMNDNASDRSNSGIPANERVFVPLEDRELEDLAKLHALKSSELKDWLIFRNILNSFGWLARRVGDYSVPESSVIFVILEGVEAGAEAERNELGLVGARGMVALRATRFEEQWGKRWYTRFTQASSANMAESENHYDRLMRGITDDLDDEILLGNV